MLASHVGVVVTESIGVGIWGKWRRNVLEWSLPTNSRPDDTLCPPETGAEVKKQTLWVGIWKNVLLK